MNLMLDKAMIMATAAHTRQVDKVGKPYIMHPLRVMLAGTTLDEMVVGVLHDVIEDTHLTENDLGGEFPKHIVDAIVALTRQEYETYFESVERAALNPLALNVKINDIDDNADPTRGDFDGKDSLLKRYAKAKEILLEAKKSFILDK